jgi:hypothetical protein
MLRVKILASSLPLILVGFVAGGELLPGPQPCISVGNTSLQMATAPWQSQLRVSFTDNPAAATVRVQLVERADIADFVVVDDMNTPDAESCTVTGDTRFISIAAHASAAEPIIYLSKDDGADYRIFVQSRTFTAREAAALLVSARRGEPTQKTASL